MALCSRPPRRKRHMCAAAVSARLEERDACRTGGEPEQGVPFRKEETRMQRGGRGRLRHEAWVSSALHPSAERAPVTHDGGFLGSIGFQDANVSEGIIDKASAVEENRHSLGCATLMSIKEASIFSNTAYLVATRAPLVRGEDKVVDHVAGKERRPRRRDPAGVDSHGVDGDVAGRGE